MYLCWNGCVCLEFVPAGVSCLCPYDNMLPIGPVILTHTHTHPAYQFLRDGLPTVGLAVQPRKS